MKKTFTTESVLSGHPDKLCDRISDKIVDECLHRDKHSKVAIETGVKDDNVILLGEITCNDFNNINFDKLVKEVLVDSKYNYNPRIFKYISNQSSEINHKVSKWTTGILPKEVAFAGDQGTMIGYACTETEELMPIGITIANYIARLIDLSITNNLIKDLFLDGKVQVIVDYDDDKISIDKVLISIMHGKGANMKRMKQTLNDLIIIPVSKKYNIEIKDFVLNPSGEFTIGGPFADAGLTGRKLMVDTYGGYIRHGGGAFSGKDPSKVDRSGAYFARYVAKNIVANGIANSCEVRISYEMSGSFPITFEIETDNKEFKSTDSKTIIKNNFNWSVNDIIHNFNLRSPIYYEIAAYGHFNRNYLPWEQIIEIK